MFFCQPEVHNTWVIYAKDKEQQILRQLSIEYVVWFCKQNKTDKSKFQKLNIENHVEIALDIVLIEEKKDCEDSNLKNLIQLGICLFLLIYFSLYTYLNRDHYLKTRLTRLLYLLFFSNHYPNHNMIKRILIYQTKVQKYKKSTHLLIPLFHQILLPRNILPLPGLLLYRFFFLRYYF